MKELEERIVKDGVVLNGDILKVDSFLNHQIDVELIAKCANEWHKLFKDERVTKILTIESSGIGIACLVAQVFKVPVVFAKKRRSANIGNDFYSTSVTSYTHGQRYDVFASKKYLSEDDRILLIDDFLAYGSAMLALLDICDKAGATVVGAGVAIEKSYQNGGAKLRSRGIRLESLAKIKSMSNEGKIEFEN